MQPAEDVGARRRGNRAGKCLVKVVMDVHQPGGDKAACHRNLLIHGHLRRRFRSQRAYFPVLDQHIPVLDDAARIVTGVYPVRMTQQQCGHERSFLGEDLWPPAA